MKQTSTVSGDFYRGGLKETVADVLTSEAPLQININGAPFSITMRTPGNEQELVRGLLNAEQVYGTLKGPFRFSTTGIDDRGVVTSVNVELDESETGPGLSSGRSLMSVSSCGICGKEDVDDICLTGEPIRSEKRLNASYVERMFNEMSKKQSTFLKSGGSHAAAICSLKTGIHAVREDIGRHNAVDKVIGFALQNALIDEADLLLVSGRVSFEIISKAYHAGIPFLAAVSAPSDLAVSSAQEMGITLMAFCRGDKLTVYSQTDRVFETK